MKIAVASSGLGTVARGIETWALDTANALHRRSVPVTLFAAAPVAAEAPLRVIPALRRSTAASRLMVRAMPGFAWRWGLKSDYALEQTTFWINLRKTLRRESFDILHVQDPALADRCRAARSNGRADTQVILAHGTEEPLDFLARFECLQHLAPWHLEQSLEGLRRAAAPAAFAPPPLWTAIPNFVDTACFRPAENDDERRMQRRRAGLPENAFLIGTAAAIKRHHKRIDYLIHEFALAAAATAHPLHLVIAGARHGDMPALQEQARRECQGRVTFLPDHPRREMPGLLRALDVFALASLFEMMPIALLEAIATGLPVITNDHPVMAWMGGPGGIRAGMQNEGALAAAISALATGERLGLGDAARRHAVEVFSETAVIERYIDYYRLIMKAQKDRGAHSAIQLPPTAKAG